MASSSNYDALASLIAAVIVAIVIGVILVGLALFEGMRCEARWTESGMQARYTFMKGCRVQIQGGSWIPEKAIRDVSSLK